MRKPTSIVILAAMILVIALSSAYSSDRQTNQTIQPATQQQNCCPSQQPCPCVQQKPCDECQYPYAGAGPCDIRQCGTFCSAGQAAPGWPYGFHDEYWLRPNTNY